MSLSDSSSLAPYLFPLETTSVISVYFQGHFVHTEANTWLLFPPFLIQMVARYTHTSLYFTFFLLTYILDFIPHEVYFLKVA